MSALQLDDTATCPGGRCEVCARPDGVAHTVRTKLGVFCMAVCAGCTRSDWTSAMDYRQVGQRVCEHCLHLGIDLDMMAAAMGPAR